jgi:hypothetical protein
LPPLRESRRHGRGRVSRHAASDAQAIRDIVGEAELRRGRITPTCRRWSRTATPFR